jgi:hypothetical protein
MNFHFKIILLSLVSILVNKEGKSQAIIFNYIDGTQASYNIQDVQKITFDLDVMNLHLYDGSIYGWNISTIGDFEYNDVTSNVDYTPVLKPLEISLFPNPTKNELTVKINLQQKDQVTINVFDLYGKTLNNLQFNELNSGESSINIDLTTLHAGVYYCQVQTESYTISKKIIKQ